MSDEMGTFRVDIEIENPARPGPRQLVKSALVDTGAELSWIPATTLESLGIQPYKTWRFRQADGRTNLQFSAYISRCQGPWGRNFLRGTHGGY